MTERKHPFALCEVCPLKNAPHVLSHRPENGRNGIAVIGSFPGAEEIQQGKAFIGESGQLMKNVLRMHEIDPDETFQTNALLCSTQGREEILEEAIEACAPRLRYELAHDSNGIKRVLAMGAVAHKSLYWWDSREDKDDPFVATINKLEDVGINVIETIQPAQILHEPSLARGFIRDVEKLVRKPLDHYAKEGVVREVHIENVSHLQDVLNQTQYDQWVAFDIETEGLNWYAHKMMDKKGNLVEVPRDEITLLVFAWTEEFAVIVPPEVFQDEEAKQTLQLFFDTRKITTWNGKYDAVYMLAHLGIHVRNDFDGMLASGVFNETGGEASNSLKDNVTYYYGVGDYSKNLDKYKDKKKLPANRKESEFLLIPYHVLSSYAALDAVYTFSLRKVLQDRLEEENKYEWPFKNIMMRAQNALVSVEVRGVKVNVAYIKKMREQWLVEMEQARVEFEEYAFSMGVQPQSDADKKRVAKGKPWKWNPGSSSQVAHLLYDILGMPLARSKKLKPRTTDKKHVQPLSQHPKYKDLKVWGYISRYRRIQKMITSYADRMIELTDKNDRIHTTFKVLGTETGRLSSDLQQIPRPSDPYGAAIRKAFTSEKGNVLLSADAAQAELRALAEDANIAWLIEQFNKGQDIHGNLAHMAFNNRPPLLKADPNWDDWDSTYRTWTKSLIFSTVYEGNEYTVAATYNIKPEVLRPVVEMLWEVMPEWKEWTNKQHKQMLEQGYVETMFGRTRSFAYINDKNKEEAFKASTNMPIQSTANDITLLGMCELVERGAPVVLIVHDAIYEDVPDEDKEFRAKEMTEVMERIGNEYIKSVKWLADANWKESNLA